MKRYHIQRDIRDPIPEPKLSRVDYERVAMTVRYPLIWVYEEYLQAWIPREADHEACDIIESNAFDLQGSFTKRLDSLGMLDVPTKPWEQLKAEFIEHGVVAIPNLLPMGLCKQLSDYYKRRPEAHDRWRDLPGIKRTSVNNSPLMRLVHQSTEKLVRYVAGDVKTSYSFTSAYEAGSTLPVHTDRPQCVYNVSIILDVDPSDEDPRRWPLFVKTSKVYEARLGIGDGVLYSGVKDEHWRDALPADIHGLLGTFFHYVPSDYSGNLD